MPSQVSTTGVKLTHTILHFMEIFRTYFLYSKHLGKLVSEGLSDVIGALIIEKNASEEHSRVQRCLACKPLDPSINFQ